MVIRMPKVYSTHWITLAKVDSGVFKVISDGLVEEGEYSIHQFKEIIKSLELDGWNIVAALKRVEHSKTPEVFNLYLRK